MIVIETFLLAPCNKSPLVWAVKAAPSYWKSTLNLAQTLEASVAVDPLVAAGAHVNDPTVTPEIVASISPAFVAFQV